jgi:hypothetical protein
MGFGFGMAFEEGSGVEAATVALLTLAGAGVGGLIGALIGSAHNDPPVKPVR